MNASEIIQLARDLSFNKSTTQYTPTQALTDLNIVYREIISLINQDVNEDNFATDFYTSSVAGQSEYSIPVTDNTTGTNGMDDLLGVFINYEVPVTGDGTIATTSGSNVITGTGTSFSSNFRNGYHIIFNGVFYRVISITSDTSMIVASVDSALPSANASGIAYQYHKVDYRPCRPERLSNLEFDQSYYQTQQPKEDPFYIKYDTGIRIFPVAENTTVGAVKLYGTYDVADLVVSPNPTTPILDNNWHYTLALGMCRFSFKRRGMINEANQAYQEYKAAYDLVINTMSDGELSPLRRNLPLLTQFQ